MRASPVADSALRQAGRKAVARYDVTGEIIIWRLLSHVTSPGRGEERMAGGQGSVLYRIRAYFIKLTSRN